jgi:hypothetical protein
MDVKSAFLNGCMKDIYMMQPKGYKINHHKGLMGGSTKKKPFKMWTMLLKLQI